MNSKQKQAEYRQNLIGTQFISTPTNDDQIRVFITGQITTAQNFPDSQIFISYKIKLPSGWKPQKSEQYHNVHLTQQQLKQLNCLQSITHSVIPVIVKNTQGGVTNKFYFCFPIDLQLLTTQISAQNAWPTILFEVFSKDSWDRIYMHGCGFVNIPSKEGTYVLKSQTWKPSLSNSSKVSQFFLGGLIKLQNLQSIAKASHFNQMEKQGPINRSLFSTQSSGTVKFQLNIATQTKKMKIHERTNHKAYKISQQTQMKKIAIRRQQQQQRRQSGNIGSYYNNNLLYAGRHTDQRLNKY